MASSAYAIPWGITTAPTVMPVGIYGLASTLCDLPLNQLTCNQISNQPLRVVRPNPMEERKEVPDVATDLRSGRRVTTEPVPSSRLMFKVRINAGIISLNLRWGWAQINTQEFCDNVAELSRDRLRHGCDVSFSALRCKRDYQYQRLSRLLEKRRFEEE